MPRKTTEYPLLSTFSTSGMIQHPTAREWTKMASETKARCTNRTKTSIAYNPLKGRTGLWILQRYAIKLAWSPHLTSRKDLREGRRWKTGPNASALSSRLPVKSSKVQPEEHRWKRIRQRKQKHSEATMQIQQEKDRKKARGDTLA